MASADGLLSGPSPLKAPAVEIVGLLSDVESSEEPQPEDLSHTEDNGEDSWSLYEDALDSMVDSTSPDNCGCCASIS